jgi:hypothetical protein
VRKAFYLVACLLLCGSALAEPKAGREVKDLHYGDVLFYFYQDDFFEAITRLTAARAMGRAEAHAEDGDLLLGGMLLSYGQHRQAAEIFQRLLDGSVKPLVRDRAWFYLARVSYDRGALEQAEAALSHIQDGVKDGLPPRMNDERQVLQAQVLMELGKYGEAAAVLKAFKGAPDWNGFVQFNLGVALVRSEHIEQGMEALAKAGTPAGGNAEQLALSDRANLALGFTEIQAKHPEAARNALQRVRLEGPYSNKALLGLGWAESDLGEDQHALVPWTELAKRDPLDPAVQESLLALPYAMARLHAYSQAASHYQDAIKTFDAESQHLDEEIAGIRSGQLLPALLADDAAAEASANITADSMNWAWQLQKVPHTPDSRYLLQLLASREFQEGLKNYRAVRFLHANLQQWSQNVAVFSDMLATRKLAYEKRLPATQHALRQVDLDAMLRRQAELNQRLSQIEEKQDALGLADAAELRQWQSLLDIESRLDKLGSEPQAEPLRQRARLLKGLLQWNLSHAYPLRLWQQKRALDDIDEAMKKAQAEHQSVDEAQTGEPERVAAMTERVNAQTPRIANLLARTDAMLARQQSYLQELAAEQLQDQQQRLQSYAVEARFALAQVYDRAAGLAPPTEEAKP